MIAMTFCSYQNMQELAIMSTVHRRSSFTAVLYCFWC